MTKLRRCIVVGGSVTMISVVESVGANVLLSVTICLRSRHLCTPLVESILNTIPIYTKLRKHSSLS